MRAETATDLYNVIGTNRNLLPNGDFKIWQRGTSQAKAGANYGYAGPDQTVVYYVGTYEQTSVTLPSRVNTTALKNTLGAGTVAPNFSFPIENGGKFLRGQTVTASWWMRASKPRVMNNRFDNVAQGNYGGAGYALYDLVTSQVNTNWTYHTRTFTLPEAMSYDHVHFEVWGNTADWAQNDWFEIAQVQVELGSVATPFEQRAQSNELEMCQRYYQQIGGGTGDTPFLGSAISTTRGIGVYSFPVTMRAAPAVSLTGVWTWTNATFTSSLTWTAFTTMFVNQRNLTIQADVASGLTVGFALIAQTSSSANDLIKFSAEL
jgi:hypothetical protein